MVLGPRSRSPSPSPSPSEVTVVLAAYNEAAAIATVVSACTKALGPQAEILVIDDGSADATADVARHAGARAISLSTNRGKGAAIRRGAHEAKHPWLVLMDADGQDDPADLPRLLEAAQDEVAMVIGSRFLGHFDAEAITPLNAWGNRGLTAVVNRLFGTRLTDTQAGFRLLRRETLLATSFAAEGFDVEVDVLLEILGSGGRVIEVPVTRRARLDGHSRLHAIRDGSRILRRILRHRLTPRRFARGRSSRAR